MTFRAPSPSAEDSSDASRAADLQRCRGRRLEGRDPYRAAPSLFVHFDGKPHKRPFNGHSCGIGGWLGQHVCDFFVGASDLDTCNYGLAV